MNIFSNKGLLKYSIIFILCFLTSCIFNNGEKEVVKESNNLIPRSVIFGNPDKMNVQISPNGKYLTYIAPYEGILNIYLAEISDIKNAKPITFDKGRGIRSYSWSYNNTHVIYSQDNDGDENDVLYSLDINTNKLILISVKGARASVLRGSYKIPSEILIEMNNRDPQFFDVYRVGIETGESKLIYKNDKYIGFDVDDEFNLRFASKMRPDSGIDIFKFVGKEEKLFESIKAKDIITTAIIGFDKTNKNFYMIDSRGRDTAALTLVTSDGKKTILGENDKADISEIWAHPTEKTILAYGYEYDREHRVILDKSIEEDFNYLASLSKGDFNIADSTLDYNVWIVSFTNDNTPVEYYIYDRTSKKAEFLFYNNEALSTYELAEQHPIIIKSRDGLNLISYLTLPIESVENKSDLTPKSPVPLVLYVHGGPTSRDAWGYSPIHQWLANRGYAVLSVNYRGSTGFGKEFIAKGDGEWAAKMHDDLIDAVNWAIDKGITTSDKVAIMGGSYGGYATLVGLTFTPDTFACGVDIVGPSNLVTLVNSIPDYWKPIRASMIKMVGGDPENDRGKEFLESRSPLTFVEKIKKPLLIAQGANDPRVKQAEADQIVDLMRKKNIPVTYLLYPDEGHGFLRPQNKFSNYAVTERFLSNCLNGKVEAVGDAFEGSSIQIVHGKEHVNLD